MVHRQQTQANAPRGTANTSLDALSRTLEALETRLTKIAQPAASMPAAPARSSAASEAGHRLIEPGLVARAAAAASPTAPAFTPPTPLQGAERRRATLADAVSEIAMRRQMLDQKPQDDAPRAALPPLRPARTTTPAPTPVEVADRDQKLEQRFQALAGDVESLRADGSNFTLMSEIAEELQRLRQELRTDQARPDPRFDEMRESFDALRAMIDTRQSPAVIGAEMSEISANLARLTEEGADRSTLNTLRAELEEMRGLFGEMARERTVAAVGQKWEAFESTFSRQSERDSEARGDLKNELERLRESLRSLASEDHVRAVEKRWDDFEDRYLGSAATAPGPSEETISKLLRDELEGMRAKLEGMSDTAPMKAVEARWGALEERLDSREIEASIQRLAERMGEIESSLDRLPDSLGIASLEQRMHALGASVDALASRDVTGDLEHFMVLEERLDEISRAIVATSVQAPAFDMAPIERIEARIAMLSSRVDRFAENDDSAILALRLGELSDRIEEIASSAVTDQLAARVGGLADRFETVFAELEQPRIDTAAIEERLKVLALRLEEAVQPRADTEMMRSLEAQIGRLTEQLAAGSFSDEADHDFDRRLAIVEQRLDENREALIAAARQAADETAARMQAAGDLRQGEHVAQLSQNLRSLEQLSRETDDRSGKVFDAVHATLLKIVDRLEQIEIEVAKNAAWTATTKGGDPIADRPLADRAAAHMAAAGVMAGVMAGAARAEAPASRGLRDVISRRSRPEPEQVAASAGAAEALLDRRDPTLDAPLERVSAPSLDASSMIDEREANRPLEPGSGAPDIGALLERVRLQQRGRGDEAAPGEPLGEAETRAAARRAVKAAVAEAEMLRSPSGTDGESERKFSLGDLVARRRKTILVGVTAVLVALAALPISKAFLSSGDGQGGDAVRLEGAANPEVTVPKRIDPPAITEPSLAAPSTLGSEPSMPPAVRQEGAATGSPSQDIPETTGTTPAAGLSPTSMPPAAGNGLLAPASTAAPQGFAARPAAISAVTPGAAILASAEAKLPASATARPAMPDGIGSPALIEAAGGNDPKALFEIGLRLLEGRGGEPKAAEALDWFAQSAKLGFAPAQYSLGTLFEKGNGIARDTGAARDWYLLAALQGNVRAMHNLAVLYATGIEGKSEPETAAEWFEKAADLGMRDSQYNLGILYARGSGVEQDLAQSYKWFGIVAKAGDKDAEAKRDEVGKSLQPAQLTAAEATVAAWAPQERKEEANTVDVPQEWNDTKTDQTASVDMKRAVRNIQAILGKLGYDAGTPDGVVGGKTTTAIVSFQKDAGLSPTGQIDETLIRALLERKDS